MKLVDATQAIYRTDLENKLANIDREAAAYRQKGLDEVSATEWSEASKAQVMASFENEVASKVDAVWKTELQNRLDDIEREKQAWIHIPVCRCFNRRGAAAAAMPLYAM